MKIIIQTSPPMMNIAIGVPGNKKSYTHLNTQCKCGAAGRIKCLKCQLTYYCTPTCAAADAAAHKVICKRRRAKLDHCIPGGKHEHTVRGLISRLGPPLRPHCAMCGDISGPIDDEVVVNMAFMIVSPPQQLNEITDGHIICDECMKLQNKLYG
jgi:hypothetical protein